MKRVAWIVVWTIGCVLLAGCGTSNREPADSSGPAGNAANDIAWTARPDPSLRKSGEFAADFRVVVYS